METKKSTQIAGQDPGQFQEQARETSHLKDEGTSKTVKPTLVKWDSSSTEVKVFILLTGHTNNTHENFMANLKKQFKSLREVDTADKSDIVLVFCPIVSRAGTDIEAALKKLNNSTASKPAALVVLHHTFDPEKTVGESSRFVNREDILTVDCLFYEDTGLLQCLKNSEAINKVVNWLKQQRKKIGVKVCPPQNIWQKPTRKISEMPDKDEGKSEAKKVKRNTEEVKVFILLTRHTNNIHVNFMANLKKQFTSLREVDTADKSDIVLVFCPIVSRAGTDIEAALKKFNDSTVSKPAALVVLHHTFDPEKTVGESSRFVNREDILTVDCLFYEDTGLLQCLKNSEAINKVENWLILQGEIKGVKVQASQNISTFNFLPSWFLDIWTLRNKPSASSDNEKQIVNISSSSSPVNYYIMVTEGTHMSHEHFMKALSQHKKTPPLKKVSTDQESDVILYFWPVSSQNDINAILEDFNKTDKPVVLILLHDTHFVPEFSGLENKPNLIAMDCVFYEGVGLSVTCQKTKKAVSAVSDWLSSKFKDH
ncbi:uncharacterized protein LOC127419774 isoform X2 [Myxocyprinus asiaticus]|uniref:uncharacterized protein LOC127419774 isoform X2 n=1 Tax=Myxocyprinus asiaticus TaxID=70543 RepID=UPI002222B4A1|nr:uncharacterized protein LOC127419774 isoform X2 [Myxocyprinus asiaticus]